MSTYKPNTINTDGISLPEDLLPLAESIAKNVHEVWGKTGFRKDGRMGNAGMTLKRHIPALYLTRIYQKEKRSMTAEHLRKL